MCSLYHVYLYINKYPSTKWIVLWITACFFLSIWRTRKIWWFSLFIRESLDELYIKIEKWLLKKKVNIVYFCTLLKSNTHTHTHAQYPVWLNWFSMRFLFFEHHFCCRKSCYSLFRLFFYLIYLNVRCYYYTA